MNIRTKILSALATTGVLAAGWGVATANGHTIAPTASAPTTGASASSSSSSGSNAASGTFTGATESHRYGSVTVTVTLAEGRITALSEKVVSDGDHHSERINSQAVPILRQELIGTDGTGVSTVSGATYTTNAYLKSPPICSRPSPLTRSL